MGLYDLTLVAPKHFPDTQATERAAGADDILANAKVVNTVEEAIQDCQWLFGTSGRQRAFPNIQINPAVAAQKIADYAAQDQKIGILFGNEQSGLSNAELQLCDYHISIATNPEFASLNLGAAVQVISYEVFQALAASQTTEKKRAILNKATAQELAGLVQHFEEVGMQSGFVDPMQPKKFQARIQRIFTKAQLEKEEIDLLRGFLKKIQNAYK